MSDRGRGRARGITASPRLSALLASTVVLAAALGFGALFMGPAAIAAPSSDFNWGEIPASVGGQITTDGSQPQHLAFSPDGRLLAVSNHDGSSVSLFSVSGSGAAATFTLIGPPIAVPDAFDLAFSPDGTLLAVANANTMSGTGLVSLFSVTGTGSGATLSALPSLSLNAQPSAVRFAPDGAVLAVITNGLGVQNAVALYTVSGAGAAATFTQIGTAALPGAGAYFAAFSPDGTLLAVTNSLEATVTIFAVTGTGAGTALTPLGAPLATGAGAHGLTFSPDGSLLVVANLYGTTASVFTVSGSGPTAVVTPTSALTSGSNPTDATFSPDGTLLAVSNGGDSTVTLFSVQGSGAGASLTDKATLATGGVPYAAVFSPDGTLLVTANALDDTLSVFAAVARTVTFEPNGGSGTMAPQTSTLPETLTRNGFTRSGYTFTGWNTAPDGSGTAYADGARYAFNADATLYAQWSAAAVTPTPTPTPTTAAPLPPGSGSGEPPGSAGTPAGVTGAGDGSAPTATTLANTGAPNVTPLLTIAALTVAVGLALLALGTLRRRAQ